MKDRAAASGQGRHIDVRPGRRRRKAVKVARVVERLAGVSRGRLVLDIGTGAGYVAESLRQSGWNVITLDIADFRTVRGPAFVLGSAGSLPFTSSLFSVVVSNHVVEHVDDAQDHLDEIKRVLSPDGVGYVATPNRLWLVENHYRLPFLSWLPRPLADAYVRLARRGSRFDVRPLTWFGLNRISRQAGLVAEDVTHLALVGTSELEGGFAARLAAKLPRRFIGIMAWASPAFAFAVRNSLDAPRLDSR